MISDLSSEDSIVNHLLELVPKIYLEVFDTYNDRFISFPRLYQEITKQELNCSLDLFHEVLLKLEENKHFMLGGYSHLKDIKEPEYAFSHPERGYLYWIFRPEPPENLKNSKFPVMDM